MLDHGRPLFCIPGCKVIQSGRPVALQLKGHQDKWVSCWGAGSDCKFRSCPQDKSNPFLLGGEHHYKCRGEVFWIHKDGGGNIHSCDVVAFEYKTGWWLSCSDHGVRDDCKTRTCPGDSWGNNWDRCTYEKFRIRVVGKDCGAEVKDGDSVIISTNESDKVMSIIKVCSVDTGVCLFFPEVVTGKTSADCNTHCISVYLQGVMCTTPCKSYPHEFIIRTEY